MKTEKHYHICEMHLRIKSCEGKHKEECENIKINGECALPEIYGICSGFECQVTSKLDWYKNELETSKADNAKLKALNTHFRTLMLMPTQAERLLHNKDMDFSGIKGLISQNQRSWDSCMDEETGIYMMTFHQKISEAYSVWLHEKNSKIKIDDLVKEAKSDETSKANKKVHSEVIDKARKEKEKKVKEANEVKAKTPYGRALAGFIKMGKSEEDARAYLAKMGYKE